MARFVVEIECDGPPFRENLEPEIAYILTRVVDKITSWATIPTDGSQMPILDSHGNRIGYAKLDHRMPSVAAE
jgi:hypothetical protein